MSIRIASVEDAPALARVLVDTIRSAHRGQVPDEALLKQPLAEAYAESEANWRRSLQEIADGDNPQAQIFVALVMESANVTSKLGSLIKKKDFPLIDVGIAAEMQAE